MKNRDIPVYVVNYLYIACLLLWGTMQSFVYFDGAGRFPLLLCIFVVFVNKRLFRSICRPPFVFWSLWTIYAIINLLIEGTTMRNELMFCAGLMQNLVVLYVSAKEYMAERNRFLKFLICLILVYVLLNGLTATVTEQGRITNDAGNMRPITCVFLVYFVLLYKNLNVGLYSTVICVLSIAYSISVVIAAATRKAFGAVVLIMLCSVVPKLKRITFKGVLIALVCMASYLPAKYLFSYSVLAERLAAGKEDAVRYAGVRLNWFLELMGDRAGQYVHGWNLFMNDPINGIGLTNYYNLGYGSHMLHTEYMVQLVETGIIGSFFFACFYLGVTKCLYGCFKCKKLRDRELFCHIGALSAILFMSFTTWTYSFPIYFIVLGIIISYTKQNYDCYRTKKRIV